MQTVRVEIGLVMALLMLASEICRNLLRGDGIKMMGDHGVVRNCWVHNSSRQGILPGGKGLTIENNLVEFNGSNVQFSNTGSMPAARG